MTRLILVRHGQTDWNAGGRYQGQSNVALSALGRRQAELLAAHFPVKHLDVIYTSDLDRARETAECVGKVFGVDVRPEKAFRRRFRLDAALNEQVGQDWIHANLVGQFLSRCGSLGCRWFVIPF